MLHYIKILWVIDNTICVKERLENSEMYIGNIHAVFTMHLKLSIIYHILKATV